MGALEQRVCTSPSSATNIKAQEIGELLLYQGFF